MSDNGRISLIFFFNLVLFFVIGEVNNTLTIFNLTAHLDILVVLFFGLYIGRTLGLLFTLVLGMLANAAHPAPPGTYVLAYMGLWLFLVWSQNRIRRQNPSHVRTIAILGQLLMVLALSLFFGRGSLASPAFWQRTIFDLLFSLLVIYLLAWPWCQAQKKFLRSLGLNLEAQLAHR